MYQDAQQLFSDAQALSATAVSTNVINLGVANRATGEVMCVFFSVDVAADFTTTDEVYQFDIQTDDNAAFTSAIILGRMIFGGALMPAVTKLVAGYGFAMVLPKCDLVEAFLRVNYVLSGTTPSLTISASLMPYALVQQLHIFQDATQIS